MNLAKKYITGHGHGLEIGSSPITSHDLSFNQSNKFLTHLWKEIYSTFFIDFGDILYENPVYYMIYYMKFRFIK